MSERELVHQLKRRTTKDRNLAAGLQPTTSAQFVELPVAGRVCTDSSGDEAMRKASTALLEQGIQTPSPAPDLIPAETSTEDLHWDWYSKRGHFTTDSSGNSNQLFGSILFIQYLPFMVMLFCAFWARALIFQSSPILFHVKKT